MLDLVLCSFDGTQQRIPAARNQQQQTLLRPVEGRDQLGAILNSQPSRRSGADINQAAGMLEARLDGGGGAFQSKASFARRCHGGKLSFDHRIQDVHGFPEVDA